MAFRGTYKWNFSNLKKVPESLLSQDSDTCFRFSEFYFLVPLKATQSLSTFSVFPSVSVQIYVGILAGKVAALCMACKGT
jgi:hypothetical protein